jgi:uncharacterized membrane protein YfhO
MPDAPDHLQVQVVANAAALLLMSEMAYPAWGATLDGQPVPIQLADGALRAVAVPPGTHVVDMAYRSQALEAGLVVSALTAALLLAVACAAAANSSREHLPRPHPTR